MISGMINNYYSTENNKKSTDAGKSDKTAAEKNKDTSAADKSDLSGKVKVDGQTIGQPRLSEKAAKYYNELKKKYSNMNFILVSKEEKENAKANASKYANPARMVVLVDEEKIEKMASDKKYAEMIEGVIANAASGMSQLSENLAKSGQQVEGFGMKINDDGTAKYFAVLKDSARTQEKLIEKRAKKKADEKKAAKQRAKKQEAEERIEKAAKKKNEISTDEDMITIEADSVEELIKKLQDYNMAFLSDNVQTDEEKNVGQKVDYSV